MSIKDRLLFRINAISDLFLVFRLYHDIIMNVITALREKLHSLRVQVIRLQHSDTTRKIKKIKRFVQNHTILFTMLAIICLVALSPFLLILAIITTPLFLVFCSFMAFLVVSASFLFGFFFNFAVVVFVGLASCYVVYRLMRIAIDYIKVCLNHITMCPSTMYQHSRRRIDGLFSQLRDNFNVGTAQQHMNLGEFVDSNNSSELEDIEPDYRDRQDKLYEILVTRQQNTGVDMFEQFQY